MTIFLTVIQVICGLLLIGIIMMQSGKSAGLSGSIAGVADSFMSKHEAKRRTPRWPEPPNGWRCVHHPDAAAEPDCLNNKSVKRAAPAGSGLFFALAGAARCFFEIFSTGAVFLRCFWYNTSHIEKTHARMVH